MLTSLLQNGKRFAFLPSIVAMADPQLPLPIMHIFSFGLTILIVGVVVIGCNNRRKKMIKYKPSTKG